MHVLLPGRFAVEHRNLSQEQEKRCDCAPTPHGILYQGTFLLSQVLRITCLGTVALAALVRPAGGLTTSKTLGRMLILLTPQPLGPDTPVLCNSTPLIKPPSTAPSFPHDPY